MKKRNIILIILLIAVVAAGIYTLKNRRPDDSAGTVVIWYVEDGTLSDGLESLAEEYNARLWRTSLPVSLVSFKDEEEMADAFDSGTPDLVLCSHLRAFDMYARDNLTDISEALGKHAPDYPRALSSRSACIGKSFFPVGSAVPVLIVNNKLYTGAEFDSMEAFCSAATEYAEANGEAFYAVSSYAELFFTCLLNENEEFNADFDTCRSGSGKQLYNLLAEAAYVGALSDLSGSDAAQAVYDGTLPCAFISSDLLSKDAGSTSVYSVPALSSEGSDSVGTAWGFAVTAGASRSSRDISAFLKWLFSQGRDTKLALQECLVPSQGGSTITVNATLRYLIKLGTNSVIALPLPDSEYELNCSDFDSELSSRMIFLSE